MSNNSSVKNKVESYIHKTVHVDKEKIKDDSLIFKEGYFDSMGFIMLIAYLEEEFGMEQTPLPQARQGIKVESTRIKSLDCGTGTKHGGR